MSFRYTTMGAGVILLTLLFACQPTREPRIPEEALAVTGDRYIMPSDLEYRLRFTPHRPLKEMSDHQKRLHYLQALIDEAMLATRAAPLQLDTSQVYRLQMREIEKDEVREALYKRQVRNKTTIPEQAYREALQRSKQERVLEYISFQTRDEAEYARNLLSSGEASFQELYEIVYKAGLEPPTMPIRWGQLPPAIEDSVYTLQPGETSGILDTGQGFLLVRLQEIRDVTPKDPEKYRKQMNRVRRQVEDRILESASQEYISEALQGIQAKVQKPGLEVLQNYLHKVISTEKPGRGDRLFTVPGEWETDLPEQDLGESLVEFNGDRWSAKDFLEVVYGRGVRFPDSTEAIGPWMREKIGILVRDELLAREGYDQGLDTTKTVRTKVNRWDNYFRSRLYLDYLKSQTPSQQAYRKSLRAQLDSLSHGLQISVDSTRLSGLTITPMQMTVVKRTTTSRLAVPPFPSSLLEVRVDSSHFTYPN